MQETVNVLGVNADGSQDLLGTAPLPPGMKRSELAREFFGPLTPDESGNDADMCLWALDRYHEWLIEQGWQEPPLVVTPNDGLSQVPEGCTPADAAMLRRANHALADEARLLQAALADLHRQVQEFVTTYGEADFYTGPALAVLAKTDPLQYRWPHFSPTQDEVISKLLARRGPNV